MLEPKPGVAAERRYLAQLLGDAAGAAGAHGVIYAAYEDPRAVRMASPERRHARGRCCLSRSAAPTRRKRLFGLFDDTIARLRAAALAG